jgi:hypothetical protein
MTQHHPEYDAYLDDPDDDATDILRGSDAAVPSGDEPDADSED